MLLKQYIDEASVLIISQAIKNMAGYLCRSVTNSFDGRREIAFVNFSSPRCLRSRMEIIMERKKSYGLLIVGIVLLIASIIWSKYAYSTSYQESLPVSEKLSSVNSQIKEIKKGEASGDLDALTAEATVLSDEKLRLERPYSYGLTLLFIAVALFLKGLYNALVGTAASPKMDTTRMVQAGFLAALCYIGFAFCKIDIPVGAEKTAFHLGNVFCVLAALLLGGYWGGLAGAVGMTIGDLTTTYVTSAPKTFLLKLCIGLIVGLVAHKIFKLSRKHSAKFITGATIVSCVCGLGFNVIADPLVGYFYKTYLLGVPQDASKLLAKMSAMTTLVNAIIAVIAATIFYIALRPALRKAGLFVQVTPEKAE